MVHQWRRMGKDWRVMVAGIAWLCLSPFAWAGFIEGDTAYQQGDYATAYREWLPLAQEGHAKAQLHLGTMYLNGLGVPQDYREAIKWFRMAAVQNPVETPLKLGAMYRFGWAGAPQDYAEAMKWFRIAAAQGDATAQYFLGSMYYGGEGVPQDYTESVKWFRASAKQGNSGAQAMLGALFEFGQGVPQDHVQAATWFRMAANQGNATAQMKLGVMYLEGRGVSQDFMQAHIWLNLAAARLPAGDLRQSAAQIRNALAAQMTRGQIAEAQRRAREWKPKLP